MLNTSRFISTIAKQTAGILKDLAIVIGYLLKDLFIAAVKIAITYGIPAAIKIGRILKRAAIVLGRLLTGLILLTATNIRSKGKPAAVHTAYWLREKSVATIRKAMPKAIEAGQISKRGGESKLGQEEKPKTTTGASVGKMSSTILGKVTEKVKERASKVISSKEDYKTFLKERRQQITITPRVTNVSAEIILEKEKTMNPNERLAEEISRNGIECKPITDIGSLPIEKNHIIATFSL
jgi:hypothetical protein